MQHSILKRPKVLLTLLAVVIYGQIFAQTRTVTGTITDADNGSPLFGITVFVKGTTNGTLTDGDGKYSIEIMEGAVIAFSSISYATQEVEVGTNSVIDIQLQADIIGLEEVVAIGYGSVKKKDLTGAVSSISGEDLTLSPITSIDAGLQGKLAGVNIQQTSGAPGQEMKIRIRGGNSINYSNNPLYVVDGFIGADIATISPSDIATIDVLKDASATAIYGSRGANGVVIITTNAPVEGDMKVSFDANWGVSNMVNNYDLLSAHDMAVLMNEQDQMRNKVLSFTGDDLTEIQQKGSEYWTDHVLRQGNLQNYTLNVNGGSEKLKYFLSGNITDENGILKESFYKRYSIRSNISGDINDWIDFKFNTFGTHTKSQNNGQQSNGLANTYGNAMTYPTVWYYKDENGNVIDPTTYKDYNSRFKPGEKATPVDANRQNQETLNERIVSSFDLNFKFTDYLSLLVSNSGSYASGYTGIRTLEDPVEVKREELTVTQRYRRNISWVNTNILSFKKDVLAHSFKVDAIYEYSKSKNRNNDIKVNELGTTGNEWHIMDIGAPSISSSSYNEGSLMSYMGRVNYSFMDRYLITASYRADGSSKFKEKNRWGYFPSTAVAWKISKESFAQNLGWLYNAKLRAGWGQTGNQAVDPYSTLSTLDTEDFRYLWYTFDNSTSESGVIPGPYINQNIKWETTTQSNIGLDFGLLGGKISGVFDLYNKLSSDVIIASSIQRNSGRTAYTNNFADISNKGFEFTLNYHIISTRDFSWSINGNFSRNNNIVEKLSGESVDVNGQKYEQIFVDDEEALGIWGIVDDKKYVVRTGESLGSFYGLKALGIWQESETAEAANYGSFPGEVKYEDLNNDGQISADDRQIIGHASPKFNYGIGTNLGYKGVDLTIQCHGYYGNDIYNFSRNMLNQLILTPDYNDRWSPTNTGSTQQIMPVGTDYSKSYIVSQYVEDGSFFKISNITIGYTFPKQIVEKIKLQKVRIYGNVNNVLTFTKYSGVDPEGSSTPAKSDSQAGIDAFSYPLTRTFTGGIKINF